jgi:transposase
MLRIALRGHLAEFGFVVAQGPTGIKAVGGMIDDDGTKLPDAVRDIARLYLDQIALLTQKIDELHFKLRAASKVDDAIRRLCTLPGVGPETAGAIMAFAPDLRAFASGRNFAAWLGLVPRQRSTGGKPGKEID